MSWGGLRADSARHPHCSLATPASWQAVSSPPRHVRIGTGQGGGGCAALAAERGTFFAPPSPQFVGSPPRGDHCGRRRGNGIAARRATSFAAVGHLPSWPIQVRTRSTSPPAQPTGLRRCRQVRRSVALERDVAWWSVRAQRRVSPHPPTCGGGAAPFSPPAAHHSRGPLLPYRQFFPKPLSLPRCAKGVLACHTLRGGIAYLHLSLEDGGMPS